MEKDFYLGRILTGRVSSGCVRVGDRVHGLRNKDSGVEKIEEGKVLDSIFASLKLKAGILFENSALGLSLVMIFFSLLRKKKKIFSHNFV